MVEEHAAHRCILFEHFHDVAVLVEVIDYYRHNGMKCHFSFIVGNLSLLRSVELQSFTLVALAELGDVVKSEHHILRRHGDRSTIGRVEDIVRAEHKHLCLKDSLVAEWQVHSHLVTVEVGVECRTCERVKLDSLTLNHAGLECLDTKAVKSRGTVEEYGVTLHHILQNVPNDRFLAVNYLLGTLHGLHNAALNELADYEWLVKLGCHIFRNTALVHLQLRTYNDYRTC